MHLLTALYENITVLVRLYSLLFEKAEKKKADRGLPSLIGSSEGYGNWFWTGPKLGNRKSGLPGGCQRRGPESSPTAPQHTHQQETGLK